MLIVRQTVIFSRWHDELSDRRAAEIVTKRLTRLARGLFGDMKSFGGIGELRIDYGPGYRLYFARRGNEVIILLCGGTKGSQARDIARAQDMLKEAFDGS